MSRPDPERAEIIRSARLSEAEHRLGDAIDAYARAGAFEEAGRVLGRQGRFREAGMMLLRCLPVGATPVADLHPEARRMAAEAAMHFARGGARREAVGLLVNLGENAKAAQLLRLAGLRKEAVAAMRGVLPPDSPWPEGVLSSLQDVGRELDEESPAISGTWPIARREPEPEPEPDGEISWQSARPDAVPSPPPGLFEPLAGPDEDEPAPLPDSAAEPLPEAASPPSRPLPRPAAPPPTPPRRRRRFFVEDAEVSREPADRPPPPRRRASVGDTDPFAVTPSAGGTGPGGGAIEPGAMLADRYRLEAEIGAGGMARVYRAVDVELEEEVALKVFLQVVEDEEGLRRFRQEMKLSRKLIHPSIVRIYEFGIYRGARFITMELLHGVDLEAWVDRHGGVLTPTEVVRLMVQATAGLQAAHEVGVIHRDVKPSNFFIVEGGRRLKLMDFGVAKLVDPSGAGQSGEEGRIGTPRYMSPEQIQGGRPIGPEADLYSLGAVMYELLTGRRVFEEEELVPLLLAHLNERPVPPRRLRPEVPEDLEAIVLRLLEKNPRARFPDCGTLRKVLLEQYARLESGT